MPHGKPAGVRCVQLDEANRCRIFGRRERPSFCVGLAAAPDMCGGTRDHAIRWLAELERETSPG
jgi:uncharacterized protein